MPNQPTYMTTSEFSSASGKSVKTITKWLREGKLKGIKKGGKWSIPAGQLDVFGLGAAPSAKSASASPSPDKTTLSVAQFSAKTYLTPFGVTEWLKKGLLCGHRDADGNWQVDAANLDLDRMKKLLRE